DEWTRGGAAVTRRLTSGCAGDERWPRGGRGVSHGAVAAADGTVMRLQQSPGYGCAMTEAMAGTNLREPLARISADLNATGVPWALTGGLAVAAHTGGGTSDDIDVAVGVADDATAEAVVRQLQERGYSAVTTVEHEFTKRL